MSITGFKVSSLFRDLKSLANLFAKSIKIIPKIYSFSIGEKMIDKSVSILYLLSMAYDTEDNKEKIDYICKAKKEVLAYESFVESLNIYGAINTKIYIDFFHILGSIKVKLNNWEKSLVKKD